MGPVGRLTLALGLMLGLAGCPRELQAPPPGDGLACERIEDCNAGRTCGELRICVGGFCEDTPSHVVVCD